MITAVPDWTDGMDDMPRRQPVTLGDLGVTSRAAVQGAALGEELRAGDTMDRAIDATAAEQRGVCRVDDGVNAQCGDVGDDDFEPHGANLPRRFGSRCIEAIGTGAHFSKAPATRSISSWRILFLRKVAIPPTRSRRRPTAAGSAGTRPSANAVPAAKTATAASGGSCLGKNFLRAYPPNSDLAP